jgi:hypothetical protein
VGEITGLIRDVKDPFFKYIAAAADWTVMVETHAGFSTGQSLSS